MRIWSLHPKYLDAKGIVALWREALLAKHVLQNKTKGYKNHPQLNRFKKFKHPVDGIDQYLFDVLQDSIRRGYQFDPTKVSASFRKTKIKVTTGQLEFEAEHLLQKLVKRDLALYTQLAKLKKLEPHPIFSIVKGGIEDWEII